MRVRIRDLDSATYVPHPLHRGDAVWHEKNCYVDLYIELLHAMGFEPLACLPFTMRIDLEGDQWTFFKFPLADLRSLFGIEVFELNIWHSLIEHTRAELALGRPVIVDMDSFHLPDARGTDYRTNHVKTSIGVQDLDIEARSLGYFHNAGYHSLAGEDFDNVFRLDPTRFGAEHLAPYVEVVKLDDARRPDRPELVRRSLELLASHLERAPRENPFARYRERFVRDLEPADVGGGQLEVGADLPQRRERVLVKGLERLRPQPLQVPNEAFAVSRERVLPRCALEMRGEQL